MKKIKAYALATIHVGRAGSGSEPGFVEVVTAGGVTELDAVQFAEFDRAGAVRLASKGELADAEKTVEGSLV